MTARPEMTIDGFPGFIPKPFGPIYPDLGTKVAKSRRSTDKKAHGANVLDAVCRLNARLCQREATPLYRFPGASGTWESCPKKILAAVNKQNAARLCVIQNWYSPEEQREKYDALMQSKREMTPA